MLKIYGSMQCPDCVACRRDLDGAGVEYEYLDFAESLLYLKEFLAIRDNDPAFDAIKGEGKIGIPCIIDGNGNVSFDWSEYVSQDKA